MPYTVLEAANLLKVHKGTILERIKKGILKAERKPITRLRWEIDDESLMENMKLEVARKSRKLSKA